MKHIRSHTTKYHGFCWYQPMTVRDINYGDPESVAAYAWTTRHDFRHGSVAMLRYVDFSMYDTPRLAMLCHGHKGLHMDITRKGKLADLINERKDGGQIYVHVDSTDCDHFRSTSAYVVDANVRAYLDFEGYQYDNAEGATYISIMTRDEYIDFMPESFDYAARAHEDGHPHVIYR